MTIIKHYINNRWKWDFDGSHTAYDVVSLCYVDRVYNSQQHQFYHGVVVSVRWLCIVVAGIVDVVITLTFIKIW